MEKTNLKLVGGNDMSSTTVKLTRNQIELVRDIIQSPGASPNGATIKDLRTLDKAVKFFNDKVGVVAKAPIAPVREALTEKKTEYTEEENKAWEAASKAHQEAIKAHGTAVQAWREEVITIELPVTMSQMIRTKMGAFGSFQTGQAARENILGLADSLGV